MLGICKTIHLFVTHRRRNSRLPYSYFNEESPVGIIVSSPRFTVRVLIPTLGLGGAEKVVVDLCNYWCSQNFEVQLLLLSKGGKRLRDLLPAVNVEILGLKKSRYAIPKLRQYEREYGLAPTIAFGFSTGLLCSMAKKLRLLKSPIIYREGSSPNKNLPAFYSMLYGVVMRNADRVIVQSNSMRLIVGKKGCRSDKIDCILNPIEPVENLCSHRTITSGMPVHLLSAGRLSPEKGFLGLIKAFCGVLRERPNSTLEIYGEGQQRHEINKLIAQLDLKENVFLRGYVPVTQEVFQTADIFILSSKYEGLPNALIHAIASGQRILSTPASCSTVELLTDCKLNDLIVANFTDTNLPIALNKCLQKTEIVWKRASGIIADRCEISRVADQYLNCCFKSIKC